MRVIVLSAALSSARMEVFAQIPSVRPLTADSIMARVAANQDTSEAERAHYVYTQHARVVSRKGKTIRCEEVTDTRVTPTATGSSQHLLKLDGRLLFKHGYVNYSELPETKRSSKTAAKDDSGDIALGVDDEGSMDRDLVENMRRNLTNRTSRDGLASGLFPLTSAGQAHYAFRLIAREAMNGHDTFHIVFEPKDKDDFDWKGDAWIDTVAYQPVLVRTAMARKIPFAVRTLLGTSLPGLGFTVIYAPQADGVWFPVSFGTEFKLHVFFFLNRGITVSATNRDFEKTHVTSTIVATGPEVD